MDLDISKFDFIRPTKIETIELKKPLTCIDIEVKDDHTFFVYDENSDTYVLSHNCDGMRIAGLYFGWWLRFCPEIFKKQKVARLMTPYVILWQDQKMTKIFKAFYSLNEYKAYESKNDISKYKKSLYKGLGSWSKEQFQKLFDSSPNGIEDFLQYVMIDEKGELYVDHWLNGDNTEKRKEYLREYNLNIENV